MAKRLFQMALVGGAAGLAYMAMVRNEEAVKARAKKAMETGASDEDDLEGLTMEELLTRQARIELQKQSDLQELIDAKGLGTEEALVWIDILEAAKKYCEVDRKGYFNHNLAMHQIKSGDATIDSKAGFACGFGPENCRLLAIENPGAYIDYNHSVNQCVELSAQRDFCIMDTLPQFCTKHPDMCHRGTLTFGVHNATHLSKEERQSIINQFSSLRPMAMQWSYQTKRCQITEEYCDSIGHSYRYDPHFDLYDCYIPLGQTVVEDTFLGATTTRRIRVLWEQTKDGDVQAGLQLVGAIGMVALAKVTFGASLVATPFILTAPTKADKTNRYAHTRENKVWDWAE